MIKVDSKSLKKAGYSFEEIQQIIESEKKIKETGISYNLDETFEYVRSKLFKEKLIKNNYVYRGS